MTAACPACLREQIHGLLCSACCDHLERDLVAVPGLVLELECTLARQARISAGGKAGLASEMSPWQQGASITLSTLTNTLTTWARDIHGDPWTAAVGAHPAAAAAGYLLLSVGEIRRHPAADELVDEIGYAVTAARREVDRAADRQYLGTCQTTPDGQPCGSELWTSPYAQTMRCRDCDREYDVAERRLWLLEQAEDLICTVREAARYVGQIGQILVTEASIRGYLHRGRIAYRAGTTIRLGDLLAVLADDSARKSA